MQRLVFSNTNISWLKDAGQYFHSRTHLKAYLNGCV